MKDSSLEKTRHFYATVPTEQLLNRVRVEMLQRFSWTKVAVLASREEYNALVSYLSHDLSHGVM